MRYHEFTNHKSSIRKRNPKSQISQTPNPKSQNKKINNKEKLDAYSYEVYNKVEFDINNIDENFKNRKVFKKFDFERCDFHYKELNLKGKGNEILDMFVDSGQKEFCPESIGQSLLSPMFE